MDDDYRNALRDLEEHRQEGWRSQMDARRELEEDIGQLYDDLAGEAHLDEWERTGRSQRDQELEDYPEGSTGRDLAEAWYDVQAQELAAENDADRLKRLKKLDKDLARSHGLKSVEQAVDQALAIDKGLREDPWGTLDKLQQRFAIAGTSPQERQQTMERHLTAVDSFMRSMGHGQNANLDNAVITTMNRILNSGSFQRTGDFQKDLRAVYDQAINGVQRYTNARR